MKFNPNQSAKFISLIRAGGFDIELIRDGEPVWKGDAPDEAFLAGVQLEIAKSEALQEVHATASRYRRQIAKRASEDRAIAWSFKAPFALAWLIHDGTDNPAIAPIVAEIQAGFEDEVAATGEDVTVLRDACISKGLAFFRATQIVEGMERLAEARIPAAATPEELETIIAELRNQEEAAKAKLAALPA